MSARRRMVVLALATVLTNAGPIFSQSSPKADDLLGTWQLVTSKNLTTGAVTEVSATAWMQLTKSHWSVLVMEAGRRTIDPDALEKLSAEERAKVNYARIWNERDEQLFQARGGTYKVEGDRLLHTATIAIQTEILGVERTLRIVRFDKTTLIVRTEFPDAPGFKREWTYRRLD